VVAEVVAEVTSIPQPQPVGQVQQVKDMLVEQVVPLVPVMDLVVVVPVVLVLARDRVVVVQELLTA
jgi:hypothetical protein